MERLPRGSGGGILAVPYRYTLRVPVLARTTPKQTKLAAVANYDLSASLAGYGCRKEGIVGQTHAGFVSGGSCYARSRGGEYAIRRYCTCESYYSYGDKSEVVSFAKEVAQEV